MTDLLSPQNTAIEIIQDGNDLFVTSLEIADKIGNEHKNVLGLIKKKQDRLERKSRVAFQTQSIKTNGGMQNREVALLTERQAMLLMTFIRNNDVVDDFKEKLVDAFIAMKEKLSEKKIATLDPRNLTTLDILAIAKQSEEERIRLAEENAILKPKADICDAITNQHGSVSVAQAAKTLNTGQKRLFQFLRENRWVTRKNEPYQDKIEAGLLDVKISSWEHHEKGIQEGITTLVTGKGIAKLQVMLG